MKIAITYENGQVFQHFGHSEQLKLYDTADNKIVSTKIISTNEQGHGAIATLLSANKADVLICGGIGAGAKTALEELGIKLCAGVTGNADEAVAAYLAGSLNFSSDSNCSHREDANEHSCGHDCAQH